MSKTKPVIKKWKSIIDNKQEALCSVRCTYASVYLKDTDGRFLRFWSFQRQHTGNNAIIRFIAQNDLFFDKDADYETLANVYNVNTYHRGFLTQYAINTLKQKAPNDPVVQTITTKTPIYFRPCAVKFEGKDTSLLWLLGAGAAASYLLYKKRK